MPAVRSVFLSDIHLGTRACKAERLVDFLREYPAQYLYLVGDVVDFWAMRRGIYWSAAQNTVVQKILRRARHGERVIFIPGNHDEALREYVGAAFGDITLHAEYVHQTADGRRFLLIHGDEFDEVTRHHRWVALLGDAAAFLQEIDRHERASARRLFAGKPDPFGWDQPRKSAAGQRAAGKTAVRRSAR